MKTETTDIIIVGTGASGLFAALHIPETYKILMLTKDVAEHSDSYLAQGGICVLRDEEDYDSFMEDTLKAGHYENRKESVEIMIRSSRQVVEELITYGVDFARKDGELDYTREGCHSKPRILFHKDITGEEITSKLLKAVRDRKNIRILENTAMVDLIEENNTCIGVMAKDEMGDLLAIQGRYTMLASGGIGGLYEHSTNYPHLTGDALAIAMHHGIELENIDYIQIHPTTLYSKKPGRRFLISESVRGEGGKLYDVHRERFANEVLPRDILTEKIHQQMKKDGTSHVWLDMSCLGEETILDHFPNIYQRCLEEGYDVTKEWIPVVPAQHYFMGGIHVNSNSRTTMEHLYAVGETSCNGVHGRNRLASNSLLESLVFAKRAAVEIRESMENQEETEENRDFDRLCRDSEAFIQKEEKNLAERYKTEILAEIEKERQER
nr:L-aspartate oxidase [uncultured Blautia sp.]